MDEDFPKLDELDEKMRVVFPRKIVRKAYARSIPEFQRLPDYVVEFLISRYADQDGFLRDDARDKIINEINNYMPERIDKEVLKSRALGIRNIELIDRFSVTTDLRRGKHMTRVEPMDSKATVDEVLVSQKGDPDLLRGGLWGKGSFVYTPGGDGATLNMNGFEKYQQGTPNLPRYISSRRKFTTSEWIDLLIKTIGLEPSELNRTKKLLYITRLIPYVEYLVNLIEMGPPGTGKSFIYERLSAYSRLVLGGDVTPAKLIYNQKTKENGILFKYDVICFDEINKPKKSVIKELVPKLQQVMASGNIERGDMEASTSISLVYQGNPKDKDGNIKHGPGVFSLTILPEPMRDTPFLDRIHGYIHGWKFDAVSEKMENMKLGLLSSYFYEIMHLLRKKSYTTLIRKHVKFTRIMESGDSHGMATRDIYAIKKLLSGFIKLVYPHGELTDEEWDEAASLVTTLRQSVLNEMACLCDGYGWKIKYEVITKEQASTTVHEEVVQEQQGEGTPALDAPMDEIQVDEAVQVGVGTNSIKSITTESYEFRKIFTNADGYLARKIPYWYFKLLADENSLLPYHGLKVKDVTIALDVIEDSGSHFLQDTGSTIDFTAEEGGIPECHSALKKLIDEIDEVVDLLLKVDVIKAKVNIDNEEGRAIYERVDAIRSELQKAFTFSSRVKLKDYRDALEKEVKFMEDAVALEPDLLSLQGYDPIIPCSVIAGNIDDRLNILRSLRIKLEGIIQEKEDLLDNKPLPREATIFNGERFPLFAVDINHLHVCLREKLKSDHPHLRVIRGEVEKKLKDLFIRKVLPAEKPYMVYIFASKHYEGKNYAYRQLFPEGKYMKWFIESTVKSKEGDFINYVDTDQLMTSETTKFIIRHAGQLTELHVGSGDKDMYHLIDTAREHGIKTRAFTIEEEGMSWKLKDEADETYLLLP